MDKDLYPFFLHLAKSSEAIIRAYFRGEYAVEWKEDLSPVTIADKKAEELIRNEIEKEFPGHGIRGEEWGEKPADASGFTWVIDPIDGTKSFVAGVPLFGTLVALLENDVPRWGMIHIPMLSECLVGNHSQTTLNGKPVRVRDTQTLSQALLLVSDHLSAGKFQNQAGFEELIRKVGIYRTWGDCYGYYLVATGRADIMIDPMMNFWDSMALIPVIRGAGGVISNYQGLDPARNWNSIVAANAQLHPEVIEVLNP